MRLTELDPHWIGAYGDVPEDLAIHDHIGVSFDCPLHRNHRLAVLFGNPALDEEFIREVAARGLPADCGTHVERPGQSLWQRAGMTFEDLTLSPSIDASAHGCWHGFITGGAVA